MPLPLDRTLKREIVLDGRPHTVTIGPAGVRLVAKGFRKGRALSWAEVWALGAEADAGGEGAGGRGDSADAGGGGTTPARSAGAEHGAASGAGAPRRTGR